MQFAAAVKTEKCFTAGPNYIQMHRKRKVFKTPLLMFRMSKRHEIFGIRDLSEINRGGEGVETWGGRVKKNELLLRGGSFKFILMLAQLLVHSINRLEKNSAMFSSNIILKPQQQFQINIF